MEQSNTNMTTFSIKVAVSDLPGLDPIIDKENEDHLEILETSPHFHYY